MSKEQRQTKAEQREAMVSKLLEISRNLFKQGYAQTSTEAIVEQAGVTRGALYHHFGNKEGLFKAVLKQIHTEVAQQIEHASQQSADPWTQFSAGCKAFLTASLDPEVQQIMLIDAPAVLGWNVWRQFDAHSSLQALIQGLQELDQQNVLQPLSIPALGYLLSGAMNEAALWIAQSADQLQALNEATIALEQLLTALRKNP